MKKIIMIFAAMAAVLSSCSKNEIESGSTTESKDIVLDISVSNIGADDTKALIKEGWADGDEISIWFDTNTGSTPDLVIKYDGSNWAQKGDAPNVPTSGSGYVKAVYKNIVIVSSKDNYSVSGNTLSFSINNWTFLTEIQVVVKNLTSTSAGSYTLACDKFTPLASTGNGYTVSADGITASKGDKGTAVTGINNTDGVAFVFATADYSSSSTDKKNFTFTLKDNTSGSVDKKFYEPYIVIEAKENKSSIKALKIENTKFAAILSVEIKMTVDGVGKTYKWAKWNLGAEKETDYGYYFAWGGTEAYVYSDSQWKSVKDGSVLSDGFSEANAPYYESSAYTKYTSSDSKTVLESVDDAATALLGNGWRMPTKKEFDALCSLTTKQWETNYKGSGINGYLFTDTDGHNIFLPAAGLGDGTNLSMNGTYGLYWSSSLGTSPFKSAYTLNVRNGDPMTSGGFRYRGLSVRAISEK